MIKIGLIQTRPEKTNAESISKVLRILKSMGKKETDIVCLPEQWLADNHIQDFASEFLQISQIAREFHMTIIPGAFYSKNKKTQSITAPVFGPNGDMIGKQQKIHPFDYEKDIVMPGKDAKVFKTKCRFGIVICYDMVFADVSKSMVQKGAEILISPSRIVKRGVIPWHMYTQVRALENRVPIIAANVENQKFGGQSIIVDMYENDRVMIPKVTKISGQRSKTAIFDLKKYSKNRKIRYSDARKFS